GRPIAIPDHAVPCEFLGVGRGSMGLQVAGGGAYDQAGQGQLATDQAGITELADANGEIEAFLDQVDFPVGQCDIELDLGMELPEDTPQGGEVADTEGNWRVYSQQPLRVGATGGDLGLGLLQTGEQ